MRSRVSIWSVVVSAALVFAVVGCDHDTAGLDEFGALDNPLVFIDGFTSGGDYDAFLNTKYDALQIVDTEGRDGSPGLIVTVPPAGHPTEWFAGGAFRCWPVRDFSEYDALTFWARSATEGVVLGEAGFGIDAARGVTDFQAGRARMTLGNEWQKFVVPIPDPSRVTRESGLFWFAAGSDPDGPDGGAGFQFFLDDVRFEKLGTITNPRPVMSNSALEMDAGDVLSGKDLFDDFITRFDVGGTDVAVTASSKYLDFVSTNDAVVVGGESTLRAVAQGDAVVNAQLGGTDVSGQINVTVSPAPTTPAPTPTYPAGDVISLFSGAYSDRPVDTWRAEWSYSLVNFRDSSAGDGAVKRYTGLGSGFGWLGIEFASNVIDATGMTHVHFDIWTLDATSFKFKLVDFGDDGIYLNAPDSEHEMLFTAATTPAVENETWVSFDIPLDDFTRLAARAHLAQIVLAGNPVKLFVDNIYFYRVAPPTE